MGYLTGNLQDIKFTFEGSLSVSRFLVDVHTCIINRNRVLIVCTFCGNKYVHGKSSETYLDNHCQQELKKEQVI